jgi:hypothetical protein
MGRELQKLLLEFVGVLEQLCAKLAADHKLYASIKPAESQTGLESGVATSKEYVRYFRSTMCETGCTLKVLTATGSARNVKPKPPPTVQHEK